MRAMRILAIETSCDETAVALLETGGDVQTATFDIRGNALYSQAKKHAAFGGVYPSLAKREHAANLVPLLDGALNEAHLSIPTTQTLSEEQKEYLEKLLEREPELYSALVRFAEANDTPKIDAIAVTQGPGLEPALWVGVNFARSLAYLWNLPIIPVNHLEGHMIASVVEATEKEQMFAITEVPFPVLGLILSGGHTEFVLAESWGNYSSVGGTRDDSIGEAFDKVARLLGIPYPGGPGLSKLAQEGRDLLKTKPVHHTKGLKQLPRPMAQSGDCDFSFSGIKTAVLYQVQALGDLTKEQRMLVAAEFEEAVSDVVLKKTRLALEQTNAKTFVVGGGVSANTYIRKRLEKLFSEEYADLTLRLPDASLSTDNAVMIGMAGYFMHLRKAPTVDHSHELRASGTMKMHE